MSEAKARHSAPMGWVTIQDILPGKAGELRKVLEKLPALVEDPESLIHKIGTIHYFKWGLINNDKQLLFVSFFDGSIEQYVDDFFDFYTANPNVPPPPSFGVGWPGIESREALLKFYQSIMVKDLITFSDYPGVTVKEVRKALALRKAVSDMLDLSQ